MAFMGLNRFFAPSRRTDRRTHRRTKKTKVLGLECLEDRTMPSVLFNPSYGAEPQAQDGNGKMSSPPVFLIFWGSYWEQHLSQVEAVRDAAQEVLQNGYLHGVRQYGSDGIATLDPLRVGDPSDPANPFKSGKNGNAIDDVVQNQIDNGPVPRPSTPPHTPIYAVVTPPGVNSDDPNAGGFNQKTGDKPEVWLGTDPVSNTNNSVNVDSFTQVFGHEIAEIMTDVGQQGFEVQTPKQWAAAKGTGDGQIGDKEGAYYRYRMADGTSVQPYWSRADQQWLVSDRNVQTVQVSAANGAWTNTAAGPVFNPVVGFNRFLQKIGGYNIVVNGDQLAGKNDVIKVDFVAVQGHNTLEINLNNEFFHFDAGTVANLTINPGRGNNTVIINNAPFRTAVTINAGSGVIPSNTTIQTNLGVTINQKPNANLNVTTRTTQLVIINGTSGGITIDNQAVTAINATPANNVLVTENLAVGIGSGSLTITDAGSVTLGSVASSFNNNAPLKIDDDVTVRPFREFQTALTIDFSADSGFHSTALGRSDLSSNFIAAPIDFSKAQLSRLTFNDGSGGNSIYVNDTPTNLLVRVPVVINSGSGVDDVHVRHTRGPVTINGVAGDDDVTVGLDGSVQGILDTLTITNALGHSAINIDDTADNNRRSVTMTVTGSFGTVSGLGSALIRYAKSDIRSVTVSAGNGGNSFTINDTAFTNVIHGAETIVNTGSGHNTLRVNRTGGLLRINMQGITDDITVGSLLRGLDQISGEIFVSGPVGLNQLTVYDTRSTASNTYVVDRNFVQREQTGRINYQDCVHVTLSAGRGDDRVLVQGSSAGTPVTVYASTGNDTIIVGSAQNTLDPIAGPVTIVGGNGLDRLTFNDQGATTQRSYNLSANQLTTSSAAPVSFASVAAVTLNVSSGGSSTDVAGSAAGTTVTVNGTPAGQDFFFADASTDAILGPVIFNGQVTASGADFTQYVDITNPSSHTYTLTSTSISRNGQATVSSNVPTILYAPMVGGNTINVKSVALGGGYKIQAASGDHVTVGSLAPGLGGTLVNILDQVNVVSYTPNDAVTLVLDDSGNTNTTAKHLTFAKDSDGNVNMLGLTPFGPSWRLPSTSSVTVRGGAANTIISMQPLVAATPLTIIGGTGSNTLDYSAYTTGVTVNLQTGTATDLAGISDPNTSRITIQNVIGGSGNDTLVAGADWSILIGGGGADQLTGGSGEAILIAGTTDYTQPSLDAAAFDAILQEWNRTDLNFDDRMSDLLTGSNSQGAAPKNVVGGTAILLNSTTVHDDLAADVLTSGTGRDWFLVDVRDLIVNQKANDRVTVV